MSRRLPVGMLLLLAALAGLRAAGPVTYQRLLQAAREPANWLMYSGDYASQRHSRLAQITAANVRRLQPLWIYQFRTAQKVETSPLVVDDILYLTGPPNDVAALDAATGRKLWSYEYQTPERLPACCGLVNRGLAVLDGRLFMATVDAHLVALDARSGRLLWQTKMAEYEHGYSATAAPLVIRDKVLIGVAGGEYGVRGFLDAYDAATGRRAWRFYTVPGPGEPGFDTWEGDSWKTGGAPAWLTGSYDPDLNLTYWTTGNPGPDWNGEGRGGDNLYSNSVLALQPDTGKLVWHFQFTPHDLHDWDATQIPVLADTIIAGRPRKVLLQANRNGFFYALDRASGEFLLAKAFVQQTWAKGMDDRGRPVRLPDTAPSLEGTKLWPGVNGGTNWYSPSYSPATGLFYVAAQEQGTVYFTASAEYRPGSLYLGGTNQPAERGYGAVRAIVPATGEIRWEHRLVTPPWAGLLSTAGNLVFGGTEEGNFFALDASTGKDLWSYPAGGRVIANPISYLSRGRQYFAIAAGDLLVAFGLGPE